MRKFVSLLLLCIMTMTMHAQQKDVTKFLGIPVDGTKSAMIQELKKKGFTYYPSKDELHGEFNGRDVVLKVATNNNKVCRIVLIDINGQSEGDIKIRFNHLCTQFDNNSKYTNPYGVEQTISESEDISYKMIVKKQRYEAVYLQNGDENKSVWFMIDNSLGEYRIIMFYDNEYNQANGEDL